MHTKETCLDDVGTVDGAGRDLDQKLSLLRLGNITRHDLHHLPFQSCENNYLGRSVLGNVHALHRRGNGGEAAYNA